MRFRPGDLCVIVSAPIVQRLVGMDCVITSIGCPTTQAGYDCNIFVNGAPSTHRTEEWSAKFSQLRLRRPPSWDKWLYSGIDEPLVSEKETV